MTIPLKEYEALVVRALRDFAPVDHVAIVEAFLDSAYDQDFRKVLTPAVAASVSRLCEIVRGKEKGPERDAPTRGEGAGD